MHPNTKLPIKHSPTYLSILHLQYINIYLYNYISIYSTPFLFTLLLSYDLFYMYQVVIKVFYYTSDLFSPCLSLSLLYGLIWSIGSKSVVRMVIYSRGNSSSYWKVKRPLTLSLYPNIICIRRAINPNTIILPIGNIYSLVNLLLYDLLLNSNLIVYY